jgi:hypothetical protein
MTHRFLTRPLRAIAIAALCSIVFALRLEADPTVVTRGQFRLPQDEVTSSHSLELMGLAWPRYALTFEPFFGGAHDEPIATCAFVVDDPGGGTRS